MKQLLHAPPPAAVEWLELYGSASSDCALSCSCSCWVGVFGVYERERSGPVYMLAQKVYLQLDQRITTVETTSAYFGPELTSVTETRFET